jgi:hypothetical protein
MRKVALFNNINLWEQHHASLLEIAIQNTFDENVVCLLTCKGSLISCPANPYHKDALCNKCCENSSHISDKILNQLGIKEFILEAVPLKIQINVQRNQTEMENFYYKGYPFGQLVLSQLADDLKTETISDNFIVNRGNLLLRNSIYLFEALNFFIMKESIDKIYFWNGRRPSDGAVLFSAKFMGIESESFITSARGLGISLARNTKIHDFNNFQKRIRNKVESSLANYDFLYFIKFILAYVNFRKARYGKIRNIGYINFNESNNIQFKIDNAKRNLVFFTSSSWEYTGMPDWIHKKSSLNLENVLLYLDSQSFFSNYNLIVRWHPALVDSFNVPNSSYKGIVDSTKNLVHILPEDKVNSYDLLFSSDLVFTFGSSIGLETLFWKGKTALIGKAPWDFLEGVIQITDVQQLKLVDSYLKVRATRQSVVVYVNELMNLIDKDFIFCRPQNLKNPDGHWLVMGTPLIPNHDIVLWKLLISKFRFAVQRLMYRK